MTVKTYSAHSMQAAMAQIKEEMGEDALIIATRRIPKAPRDPYGKDLFQIEAAPPPSPAPSPDFAGLAGRDRPAKDDEMERITARFAGREPSFPARTKGGSWESVQADLGSLRELLFWAQFNDDTKELIGGDREAMKVYSRLITGGLSEKRARYFLRKAMENPSDDASDFTLRVLKGLIETLETVNPFTSRKKDGPVHAAFVGPTGVGKTTTIAKLAAYIGLKRKKKVGLVSVDSYRIGAVEQLKTYSAIIGLPCIPAFTAEDLKKALAKLSGMDVVLIDTAGQSHLDTQRMTAMKNMLAAVPDIETHLVISASMERMDMREAVTCFTMLSPSSYVFSKVDETRRSGRVIDQMLDHRLPLSFITNGQEVPEDLIVATRKQVLNLLVDPDSFRKQGAADDRQQVMNMK